MKPQLQLHFLLRNVLNSASWKKQQSEDSRSWNYHIIMAHNLKFSRIPVEENGPPLVAGDELDKQTRKYIGNIHARLPSKIGTHIQ